MIGPALLVIGLLLILTALAATRGADRASTDATSLALLGAPKTGRDSGWRVLLDGEQSALRAFVLAPIRPATWYANGAIAVGVVASIGSFSVLVSLASAGFATLVAGIGIALIACSIEGARLVARFERWRVMLGRADRLTAHSYRPFRGGIVSALRSEFADENRWRDVLYVGVGLPLALIEGALIATTWGLALWLVTIPGWYAAAGISAGWTFASPLGGDGGALVIVGTLAGLFLLAVASCLSQLVIVLHRALVTELLCTSESRELRRQVETLRASRSAVLDVEAGELHRIERDLHDGAQQSLVLLTIELGRASEHVETDPELAKRLILDGQELGRQALAELRDLVRGIAPSILVDRGLLAALSSIAARSPVMATVQSGLAPGERFAPAIERAAYFVVAEALTNVAKHSNAERCEVRCRRDGAHLIVEVWDDGGGGATEANGGGLAGLAARLAGIDGTLILTSPVGGPTLVHAELPVSV